MVLLPDEEGAAAMTRFKSAQIAADSTSRVASNQVTKETDSVLQQLSRCISDAARGSGSYVATIVLVSGSDEPMVAIRRASAEEAVAVFERECQARDVSGNPLDNPCGFAPMDWEEGSRWRAS